MKCRSASKMAGFISSILVHFMVVSFIWPKSSAFKTDDRAANTHRCALKSWPPTLNVTSAPSPCLNMLAKSACRLDSGTGTMAMLRSSVRVSFMTVKTHRIVKQSSFRDSSSCSLDLSINLSQPQELPNGLKKHKKADM